MIGVVLTPLAKTMWRGPHSAFRSVRRRLRSTSQQPAASSQVPPESSVSVQTLSSIASA